MKCPYCNTAAHMPWRKNTFEDESSPWGGFSIDHAFCPECGKLIVRLCHSDTCRQESLEEFELGYVDREEVIYPTTTHHHTDSKALRKERQKKIALGHKEDDHEEEPTWQQTM